MKKIIDTLESLGLNEKEVKIYLTSLSMGQTSASILGKKAGIARSTSQYTCNSLVEKRLMNITPQGNSFLYSPEPPEKIISMVNKEYTQIEKKMQNAHSIMGYLNSLANPNAKLPKVKYYTGVDGLIDMFEDTFKVNETVYGAIEIVDDINEDLYNYINTKYYNKRIKSKINTKVLFNDNDKTREYRKSDQTVNRISLLVPLEEFPFDTCTHIYGNKVALFSALFPQP